MEKQNINYDYKKIKPFKWFVLNNFPFIEEDFDALTNWQLFCKLGKEINNVITSQNLVGEQAEKLTDAFNQLSDYVNNYFDNLDVTDEINNKLDDMVTDGTMDKIINQEIFSDINNKIATNSNNILSNNTRYKIIGIGDSYGVQQFKDSPITKYYWEYLTNALNLILNESFYKSYVSGASFANGKFLEGIQSLEATITDKDEITDILISAGWNDIYQNITEDMIISGMTNFNNYVKSQYPNTRIKLAFIGYSNPYITGGSNNVTLVPKALEAYKKGANILGWQFLNGCENILHYFDNSFWQNDGIHPSQKGQDELGHYIVQAFLNGNVEIFRKSPDTGFAMTANGICSEIPIGRNTLLYTQNNNITKINSTQLYGQYFTLDNATTLTLNGANTYQLATVTNNVFYGWNNRNSNVQPIEIQVTRDGALTTYHGIANFFISQGRLMFVPLCLDTTTNQAVSNVTGRYLFVSSINIISDTKMC